MSIEYYQAPVKLNIVNYQEDVVNKLQIHKIADNVPQADALEMLYGKYKDDFDCVSTLTDKIIKPTYETTDDHIIAVIPLFKGGDLFRFNKIQFMEDNVVIDNVVIDKIQLALLMGSEKGRVVIDDLEKLNIYYPTLICQYNRKDIRVFIDKTSITRQNLNIIDLDFNVMLTYDEVYLNTALRRAIATQNYQLFEGNHKKGAELIAIHNKSKL
jgi:hypothetical protein